MYFYIIFGAFNDILMYWLGYSFIYWFFDIFWGQFWSIDLSFPHRSLLLNHFWKFILSNFVMYHFCFWFFQVYIIINVVLHYYFLDVAPNAGTCFVLNHCCILSLCFICRYNRPLFKVWLLIPVLFIHTLLCVLILCLSYSTFSFW